MPGSSVTISSPMRFLSSPPAGTEVSRLSSQTRSTPPLGSTRSSCPPSYVVPPMTSPAETTSAEVGASSVKVSVRAWSSPTHAKDAMTGSASLSEGASTETAPSGAADVRARPHIQGASGGVSAQPSKPWRGLVRTATR